MGDRALVVFTDKNCDELSPVVYLHWDGYRVSSYLDELFELMGDRRNDVQYMTARFIGICHSHIDGNASLGTWNSSPYLQNAVKESNLAFLKHYTHGDAGVFIVNADTFKVETYGGYGLKPNEDGE